MYVKLRMSSIVLHIYINITLGSYDGTPEDFPVVEEMTSFRTDVRRDASTGANVSPEYIKGLQIIE